MKDLYGLFENGYIQTILLKSLSGTLHIHDIYRAFLVNIAHSIHV